MSFELVLISISIRDFLFFFFFCDNVGNLPKEEPFGLASRQQNLWAIDPTCHNQLPNNLKGIHP